MTEVLTEKPPDAPNATIQFHAKGVTGTDSVEVKFQRATPADTVAQSLADMLGMPADTAYGVRDDGSLVYLDDRPIGDQLEPGAQVTLTPKTHLG